MIKHVSQEKLSQGGPGSAGRGKASLCWAYGSRVEALVFPEEEKAGSAERRAFFLESKGSKGNPLRGGVGVIRMIRHGSGVRLQHWDFNGLKMHVAERV